MVSLWPSMEDYDSNISLLIGLLLLATSAAFAATYLRETSRRIEQSFIGWANVSEEISDWSRREYFLERILLECSRAQSDGGFFAVLSLRVSGQSGNNNENILRSMRALERFVSDYDCLSSLGPNEIGVIALGLQDRDAKGTAQQLIQAIVDGLSGDEYSSSLWLSSSPRSSRRWSRHTHHTNSSGLHCRALQRSSYSVRTI